MTGTRPGGVRVAVCGTGSWGTAFAALLADNGAEVRMWGKFEDEVEDINTQRASVRYLPDLLLPDNLEATTDPAYAFDEADLVILAIPAQSLRANLTEWGPALPSSAVIGSLIKGIEFGTTKRASEVVLEVLRWPAEQVAVISGPNLAREIAAGQPAATVVACTSEATARWVAEVCATPAFRPYTNTDVVGCELAGSFKNVVALAVGMAHGLGYGDNARAAILTRGLIEMSALAQRLGAQRQTLLGLAGIGDLVTTCMSDLSRNQTFGRHLGSGLSVDEVVAVTKQTAEGVHSCKPLLDLAAAHGVAMPLVASVVDVIHAGIPAREAIARHV